MKKIQLFLVMLLVSCLTVSAQNLAVTGKVTYADDGSPVIGATIKLKGTNTATLSDVNGYYKITIPSSAAEKALVVSFTGLETKEIKVSQSGNYDVAMNPDATEIEDVVVVGYGSARKMNTTVGSVTQVSGKKLGARPTASVMDAMQGQVAGLQVYTSSGEPGTMQSVRLHGIGSLTASSTPLYVLDGVQIDPSLVMSMNPNDFESISVLKDASATSIYGSRAANGVIYITSKRGTLNTKTRVTARAQYGISSLANQKFYDQMMSTDQLWNFWVDNGIRTQAQIDAFKNAGYDANTRWIDYYQRNNVPMTQTEIMLQGGGGKTTYMVSASQYHQEGTAPGSFFDRYTVRSNIESQANSWLKLGVNMHLSDDTRQNNSNYGTNALSGGISFLRQPFYSPYNKETGEEEDFIKGMNAYNPNYIARNNPDVYTKYAVLGNAFVQIEPVKNLKIMSRLGINYTYDKNDWYRYPSYKASLNNGQVGKSTTLNLQKQISNTIEYMLNIKEDHKLTALLGQEGTQRNNNYYYAQSTGQTDDRLLQLENGLQSTYAMSSSSWAYNELSFFGRLDYSFRNKLFVDASVRSDASSRFSAANRNATFWSAGAMYDLKKEAFLANNNTISGFRLKASYGTQGNSLYGSSSNNYGYMATTGSTTNYGTKAAWTISQPGNPDLKWETQTKLTAGVNIQLWNKLDINVEYYNRSTEDMLMNVPIPSSTGFETTLKNVGSLVNNGVDINLTYNILTKEDYYLTFSTVFNYNAEKVTKLFDGRSRWEIANTGVAYVVGEPVMYYYPIYAGVNSENGKQQWYKPGSSVDQKTTNNGVTESFNASDLTQNTGFSRYAPISGGFSVSGGWKGIALQADFSYVLGKYLISNDRYFSENPNQFAGYNTSSNVLAQWKSPGDIAEYPDWSKGAIMQFDTHLLDNASFLRLKNLQLSYSFPSHMMNKIGINGLKIFAVGRNLLTVTKFRGIDPEVDSNLSLGALGNSKQYGFGIELVF